jgi:hypothetical protein
MKRIFGAIRRFFLPPDSAKTLVRVIPLVTVAFIVIVLFVFSNVAWEYTNEADFCGLTCHTMPPEYITHKNSAHANVSCEDCHMGRDKLAVMIPRKIMYSWQTGSAMASGIYEYPIVAHTMRPANVSCENCHKPETFTSDALVEIRHFANDQANTPTSTYLSLKIGGGSARQGLGRGIHWHIENPVYFYASDRERQTIPYVVVTNPDGTKTGYIDTESGFDPSSIKEDELQKMDCITCHNRTAHGVADPGNAVDNLMTHNLVSQAIPNIKIKSVEVISASYPNLEVALVAIGGLDQYYKDNFSDFYSANQDLISTAIQALKDQYTKTNFPDQEFNWKTHPNNKGHTNSPGCFRCHDGKHLTPSGDSVRLECNICHTIPVVTVGSNTNAILQLNSGPEPDSHLNSNWITMHRTMLNNSCKGCHTTEDPGGTSNKSFCSNSACHGAKFTFAGFDAPKLRQVLSDQADKMATSTPEATPKP